MKTNILSTTIFGALLLFVFLPFRAGVCQGQTPPAANAPDSGDYSIVQSGPHFRLWQNSAGQTVTEIAAGMNDYGRKVQMALGLRQETIMTLRWMARRLNMGVAGSVANSLRQAERKR